jgi:hypothetical protein
MMRATGFAAQLAVLEIAIRMTAHVSLLSVVESGYASVGKTLATMIGGQ